MTFNLFEDYWYRQPIPTNLGLTHKIEITSQSAGIKGCGTAIYKLSEETYNNIQAKGLSYLNSDLQPRKNSKNHYQEWRETPRPDWTREENWSFELQCGGNLPPDLYSSILESAKSTGSYYTIKHEAVLMVLPEKRLVVFSHNG